MLSHLFFYIEASDDQIFAIRVRNNGTPKVFLSLIDSGSVIVSPSGFSSMFIA